MRELVKAARARGEDLTGPGGLLKTITATVLQAALEEEMTEHLVVCLRFGKSFPGRIRDGCCRIDDHRRAES